MYGSAVTTRGMPHQERVQLIVDELDKDISGNRGLDNIKARLAFLGFHLTRDFISDVMHEFNAEGPVKALNTVSLGLRRSSAFLRTQSESMNVGLGMAMISYIA